MFPLTYLSMVTFLNVLTKNAMVYFSTQDGSVKLLGILVSCPEVPNPQPGNGNLLWELFGDVWSLFTPPPLLNHLWGSRLAEWFRHLPLDKVRSLIPGSNLLCSRYCSALNSHKQAREVYFHCSPSRLSDKRLNWGPSQSPQWCGLVKLSTFLLQYL